MQIDRERLALAILNSDRVAGGWPRIETRTHVPHSEGYLRNVDDLLADIAAQGFVIVPCEPTQVMLDAVCRDAEDDERMREDWRTMIDAGKREG